MRSAEPAHRLLVPGVQRLLEWFDGGPFAGLGTHFAPPRPGLVDHRICQDREWSRPAGADPRVEALARLFCAQEGLLYRLLGHRQGSPNVRAANLYSSLACADPRARRSRSPARLPAWSHRTGLTQGPADLIVPALLGRPDGHGSRVAGPWRHLPRRPVFVRLEAPGYHRAWRGRDGAQRLLDERLHLRRNVCVAIRRCLKSELGGRRRCGCRSDVVDVEISLPAGEVGLSQDEEWYELTVDGEPGACFPRLRPDLLRPGVYERLLDEELKCVSPTPSAAAEGHIEGEPASELRVLGVGAGNGMVGEQLAETGAEQIVGIDSPQGGRRGDRARPARRRQYFVLDLTDIPAPEHEDLRSRNINCLTSVAALGFGDIRPPPSPRPTTWSRTAAHRLLDRGGHATGEDSSASRG